VKHEWHLALGTAVFLGVVAIIYYAWSGETSGSVLLLFGAFAYGLMFAYIVLQWFRRKKLPRAEDRIDANPEDGAGEIGFFPGNSMWPAAMGISAISLAIGLAFGKWFWVIGGILLVGAIIGFAVEAESR
jgi:hypothetical protein